jgi:hypothetical protein
MNTCLINKLLTRFSTVVVSVTTEALAFCNSSSSNPVTLSVSSACYRCISTRKSPFSFQGLFWLREDQRGYRQVPSANHANVRRLWIIESCRLWINRTFRSLYSFYFLNILSLLLFYLVHPFYVSSIIFSLCDPSIQLPSKFLLKK